MKKISKQFLAFLLVALIIVNTFYSSFAYASESDNEVNTKDEWVVIKDVTDDMKPINKFAHKGKNLSLYLLAQCGAIGSANLDSLYDNTDWLNNVDKYGVVVKNTTTGKFAYKFDKALTDDMLNKLKEANKEPDNGGYELLKTVPANKISSLYFEYPLTIQSMYNLLKDNDGIIGLGNAYGYAHFYQIPKNVFYVKGTSKYNYAGTLFEYDKAIVYKNLVGGAYVVHAKRSSDQQHVITGWDDSYLIPVSSTTFWNSSFGLYDSFSQWVDFKKGLNPTSMSPALYLVTNSGVSIPVFNTIDDAVAYSVANNLYYTSSDYTGEGKEIIIEFDQIENINNGYYTDMYTLLQQMIEQKGGNALTPEQLQQIVDEVRASFGLIKDEINKGFQQQDILIQKNSGILQNIADALNTFFAETKRFRESMDELLRDYIGGGGGTVGSETKDYHIKIQSVPNSNLAANQREFSIETDMENPYYESCLAWYPLNGISDIQYTGSNTCILTFFNYNKRYNVYCKYNDTGQDIRCTSNTVSVTIGAPDEPPLDDTNIWDGFADSLNEKLTDIKNSLVDLHDDMNAKFGTLNESVDSFASSFAHFSQNCLGYLKEIKDNIGSNKQLPGLPAPDGGDWDILEFLLDIAKNIADNSIDEATQKVGDLISEILTGISDIFGMLSEVFPFSIPWDIALLIGALSAEPEAPYFEVPFKLDSWGIECTLVLDFEQFEIMSTISRAFLSLTWAMYLMNFTVKFTDTKNL